MVSVRKLFRVAAAQVGVDLGRLLMNVAGIPRFVRDLAKYSGSRRDGQFPIRVRYLRPMLLDRGESAGMASGHYFHQDLWAARKVVARRPARHLDIGSRLDGFVAHVLASLPVEVVDIRPVESTVAGLTFVREDATELARFADDSVESLSSLHAIEHFGLGRYGDPVDAGAWARALRSMARVLEPGGRLYLGVPVGVERVEFNAHRVFDPRTILRAVPDLTLVSFAAVDDSGLLRTDVTPDEMARARYACGLFEFTKPGGDHRIPAHPPAVLT